MSPFFAGQTDDIYPVSEPLNFEFQQFARHFEGMRVLDFFNYLIYCMENWTPLQKAVPLQEQ